MEAEKGSGNFSVRFVEIIKKKEKSAETWKILIPRFFNSIFFHKKNLEGTLFLRRKTIIGNLRYICLPQLKKEHGSLH